MKQPAWLADYFNSEAHSFVKDFMDSLHGIMSHERWREIELCHMAYEGDIELGDWDHKIPHEVTHE